MARIFEEGFDDFNDATDVELTAAVVLGTPVVVTGRGGQGKGLETFNETAWAFKASSPIITGQAIKINSSIVEPIQYQFRQGGTVLMYFLQNDPIGIDVYDSTNTKIFTFSYSGWFSYIEVKLTCGTSTGNLVIKVDEIEIYNAAGTFGADGSLCDAIYYKVNSSNTQGFIDDLYVNDTTGSENIDFEGDTRILSFSPTGDGADLQWTPSTGMTHYNLVNEFPIDYDTSYVDAPTTPLSDTYTFAALTFSGTVSCLSVRIYTRTVAGGADKIQGIIRIAGTDYLSPAGDIFVPAIWSGLDLFFPHNPATTNSWVTTEIGGASSEAGQKRTV